MLYTLDLCYYIIAYKMIKPIITFLLMPFVLLAQENNLVCIEDVLINVVPVCTGNYFQNKNNFF